MSKSPASQSAQSAQSVDATSSESELKPIYLSRSPTVAIILLVWFSVVLYSGLAGAFDTPTGEFPVPLILAAGGPPVLVWIALLVSPSFKSLAMRLDLAELTAMQSWRIIGAAFLFAWMTEDLPAVFAFPAGVGDILVGLIAPLAAITVALKFAGWRQAAWGVVIAGMADFMIVVSIGLLARDGMPLHFAGHISTHAMGVVPYGLFPTFLVPAFIILHIFAIMRLRA